MQKLFFSETSLELDSRERGRERELGERRKMEG
jgi:hypothetical protein